MIDNKELQARQPVTYTLNKTSKAHILRSLKACRICSTKDKWGSRGILKVSIVSTMPDD